MAECTGFNIENMVNVKVVPGDEDTQEPKVEQLMGKLRRLQEGKRVLEEEIKDAKSACDSLQKELETLQTESSQLEEIHKEKEELCRKLQFQCEESELESTRQLNQNMKREELLERDRCEIQELKLKQRKQRMKFEQQLHQLIEQHKNLHSIFTPERLPGEVANTENIISQLVSAEQLKLDQLSQLNEELDVANRQDRLGATAGEITEQ